MHRLNQMPDSAMLQPEWVKETVDAERIAGSMVVDLVDCYEIIDATGAVTRILAE